MGKGTILSGGKDGLYLLNIDYGDEKRQKLIQQLDARASELVTSIATAQSNYDNQKSVVSAKESELNAAIDALNAALNADPEGKYDNLFAAVKKKTDEYQAEVKKLKPYLYALETLKAERNNILARRSNYANLKLIESKDAWCADLTENATGEVATIEVPGEPVQVLIAPGGVAPQKTDGQVLARELMTPEQVYVNAALLPGWQKWKPTYRIGTIVDLKETGATVNVRYEESTANNLKINQTASLSNVPIKYMDCDDTAFAIGDQVLIRFENQNWKNPKIIGFASNPKSCVKLEFNGAVYRQPLYYTTAVWSGNTNPAYSPNGFENLLPGTETPITSWAQTPFGVGPDNTTFIVTSIYINTELVILLPQDLDKYVWDNRETANYTVNGKTLQRDIYTEENYGYVELEFDEYSLTDREPAWPNYYNNRFQVSTYIGDADPSLYAIEPCGKVASYIYIHEEYSPGNPDGGFVVGNPPYASYGVSAATAINIAQSAAHSNFQLFFQVGNKVLFNGTLYTTTQLGKPPGLPSLYDGFVCLYEGPYIPSTPWKWSGAGIQIPPEVTWIQKL